MAKAVISNIQGHSVRNIKNSEQVSSVVTNVDLFLQIEKTERTTGLKGIRDTIAIVSDSKIKVKAEQFLPFRVRFTSIGIEGYGPNNPAPIGIAVIGFSNYIL
jgi:hypothetical protein